MKKGVRDKAKGSKKRYGASGVPRETQGDTPEAVLRNVVTS